MKPKDRVFWIIYRNVINKHPNWSKRRTWGCIYACYNKQNKMIKGV